MVTFLRRLAIKITILCSRHNFLKRRIYIVL